MKIKSTQRSSTGAAHLGPGSGCAFRRGPLLAPEDAGGAAGGASGGEPPATPPAPPAAPPTSAPGTAPGGEEKHLPQSQVNALVAQARREGREQALREAQAPQPPAAPPPSAKPETKKTVEEQIADLRADAREDRERARFERELVRFPQVNEALTNRLFRLARAEGVAAENFGTWIAEAVTQFGFQSAPAPATPPASSATPSAPSTTTPAAPPPAAPAAPSPHSLPTANGVVDLFNLTPAQLRELGPQGVRKNLEQLWAIGNQMSGAPERPKPPSQR